MECAICNASVPDEHRICPDCGAEVPGEQAQASPVPESASQRIPPPFFAVALWKLAAMSFLTLGLYDLYWFYRNWQRIRVREQRDISPAARVFLGWIFCFPCVLQIRRYGLSRGVRPAPPVLLLAGMWLVAKLIASGPRPTAWLALGGFLFLLPVQAYTNRANSLEAPDHDRNDRLTRTNWIWMVLGAVVLLGNLLAFLSGPVPQSPAP